MRTKLVIFDLDGTLLDTIEDLAQSVNYVLQRRGYPMHGIEQYKYFVGNGVKKLIEKALPADLCMQELVESVQADFFTYYAQHGKEKTQPYQGIQDVLAILIKKGVMLAVASNKHHCATVELVEHYFGKNTFKVILGKRQGVNPKPDPTIVYDILQECGVDHHEVLYVGDSSTDMDTATNASVRSVGVTWGFRSREELAQHHADYIIDTPAELLGVIGGSLK